MGFYESIAEHYDDIFPLDEAQISFVSGTVPQPHKEGRIVDVGCGTGSLAIALARLGFSVIGIDLDGAMVERAIAKQPDLLDVGFQQMDMVDIGQRFEPSSLAAILCFGNTLVHIEKPDDVSRFLGSCRRLLTSDGRLLLQILNYDHILAKCLPGLPTIENDRIRFERAYSYAEGGRIAFKTVLTVKATGLVVRNDVPLYPLKRGELESLLVEAGFSAIHFYGNFNKGPLTPESLPLVVEAE